MILFIDHYFSIDIKSRVMYLVNVLTVLRLLPHHVYLEQIRKSYRTRLSSVYEAWSYLELNILDVLEINICFELVLITHLVCWSEILFCSPPQPSTTLVA